MFKFIGRNWTKTSHQKEFPLRSLTRGLAKTGIFSAFQLLGKTFQKKCPFKCLLKHFFTISRSKIFSFCQFLLKKQLSFFPILEKWNFYSEKTNFFQKNSFLYNFWRSNHYIRVLLSQICFNFCQKKINLKIRQLANNCWKIPVVRGWSASHYKQIQGNSTVPLST